MDVAIIFLVFALCFVCCIVISGSTLSSRMKNATEAERKWEQDDFHYRFYSCATQNTAMKIRGPSYSQEVRLTAFRKPTRCWPSTALRSAATSKP